MPKIAAKNVTGPKDEPLEAIAARIQKTFYALDKLVDGVIGGNVRSLIISGAAGCGKTYAVEKKFKHAERGGEVEVTTIKGSMSPPALYRELHECQTAKSVLVIDDCDSVFDDLDSINLLKAALDTGSQRMVHWNKESAFLKEENLERNFEFNGAVVFITNIDFTSEIARQTRMAPHYEALLSRSLYVDLGIHNKREILVRVGQVVVEDHFLKENNVSKEQVKEMLQWLNANLPNLRTVSIRSMLHLASIYRTNPTEWKDLATVAMNHRKKFGQ